MWSSAALSESVDELPDRVRSMPEHLTHCLTFLSASYALSCTEASPGASVDEVFSPALSKR